MCCTCVDPLILARYQYPSLVYHSDDIRLRTPEGGGVNFFSPECVSMLGIGKRNRFDLMMKIRILVNGIMFPMTYMLCPYLWPLIHIDILLFQSFCSNLLEENIM